MDETKKPNLDEMLEPKNLMEIKDGRPIEEIEPLLVTDEDKKQEVHQQVCQTRPIDWASCIFTGH